MLRKTISPASTTSIRGKGFQMKRLLVSGLVVASLLAATGYVYVHSSQEGPKTVAANSPPPGAPVKTENNTAEPIKTMIIKADMGEYSDVPELAKNADLIVRGKVTDVSFVEFNSDGPGGGVMYTKVTLAVNKSWSPKVQKGDTLTILEAGGITTLATIKRWSGKATEDSITQADEKTKVQVLLDGAPLARVGEEAAYFLGGDELGIVPGEHYISLGLYQGKFNLDAGVAHRFVPEGDTALPELKMSADELDTEISAAPKK